MILSNKITASPAGTGEAVGVQIGTYHSSFLYLQYTKIMEVNQLWQLRKARENGQK